MTPKVYPYKSVSVLTLMPAVAFAALLGVGFAYAAKTNRRAWRIEGIYLTPTQATDFWAFLCGFCVVVLIPLIVYVGVKATMTGAKEFALRSDRLVTHLHLATAKKTEVPYASIRQISVTTRRLRNGRELRTLNIQHAGGVTKVMEAYFLQKGAFEEVVSSLQAMLKRPAVVAKANVAKPNPVQQYVATPPASAPAAPMYRPAVPVSSKVRAISPEPPASPSSHQAGCGD